MGVLVRDGDKWGLPVDHAGAVKRRMDEPYTTVTRRRVRERTSEGRWVVWVKETVTDASENERAAARKEKHRKDRELFAQWRSSVAERAAERAEEEQRQDDECRALLNAWDEEREAPDYPYRDVADGLVAELEPVDQEVEEKVVEHSETLAAEPLRERTGQGHATRDAREGAVGPGTPSGGSEAPGTLAEPQGASGEDLSDLAKSLGEWLEKYPGDHPARHAPGDRRVQTSRLGSTLWAHTPGRKKPEPSEVAAALAELERVGRKEAA